MKNFFLISLLLLPFFCGSISGWTEKYFDATKDESRLDALKFIHCQPVLDQFTGDAQQVQLLDSLLTDALNNRDEIESPDKYVINLVFKNYVRFDLENYDQLEVTARLAKEAGMSNKELRRVIKNIPKDALIRKDNNVGASHEIYSVQVAKEIDAIYQ